MFYAEEGGESFEQPLFDNLVMTVVRSEQDAWRLDEFNTTIHGEEVRRFTHHLIAHHPNTRSEDFLYVEDRSTGQIVSSICLIPWTWCYEDVELKAGELGIVGTLPGYRGRGLIRTQMARFKEMLREGGYLLSQIQGILYFYRQFGYDYAIPLEGGWVCELRSLPADEGEGYHFRQASLEDIPTLASFYDEAAKAVGIHAPRGRAIWDYLLTHTLETETAREFWLVLDGADQPVGYWAISLEGFGTGLIVSESSRLSCLMGAAIMPRLRKMAEERGKDCVRFNLPAFHDLVQVAQGFGARGVGMYPWQIHLPDVVGLLKALGPVLERRLPGTPFAGLTEEVTLNAFREGFCLDFKAGKLVEVRRVPGVEEAAINLPPNLLPLLLLGYRTPDELRACYPDAYVEDAFRPLMRALFPRVRAFIHTIY
jgi:GNAT superfamily N-acetyltransferase